MVLALGAGGGACASGKEPDEEHQAYVGAEEVCGGLFAGPSAEMLEKVTGKKVFGWASGNGMEKVVAALKEGYASDRSWGRGADLCEPDPKGGNLGDKAGISFSIYEPQDVEDERLPAGGELYTAQAGQGTRLREQRWPAEVSRTHAEVAATAGAVILSPVRRSFGRSPHGNGRPRTMGAAVPFRVPPLEAVTGFEPV
ncbi:hypothetical protein [Streptomyces sp. NPDC006289]|uniref:hypothetical protein n=1 Tax=Streptomyces sp. NPDC006289 TaxID=3156744 RepID=UPI0033BAD20A